MSAVPAAQACVVLMLKAPERSKRRLAAEIGAPAAAAAAERLAACALEDLADWAGAACAAPASPEDRRWVREQADAPPLMLLQGKGNLGRRISRVDRELRKRGYDRTLFVGIDCPLLDAAYLRAAAQRLATHDAVLGPADDGGVVLMGAGRPWPELGELPWSTDALCAALRRRCEDAGWRVAALEPRPDVDTLSDLIALEHALAADPRPARRALRRWLASAARPPVTS